MQRAWALVAAVTVVASGALAGDQANPEITDAEGDTQFPNATWADIVAGWFNETATDIVATIAVADASTTFPATVWYVVFDSAGQTFGAGCQSDPGAGCFYGHWDRAAGPTDFAQATGGLQGDLVTVNVPRDFANATAGAVLTTIEAGTGQLTPLGLIPAPIPAPLPGQAFFQPQDDATASRDYVMGGALPAPAPANNTGNNTNETAPPPPQRTPGLEAPAVVAATLLLALAVRRRP